MFPNDWLRDIYTDVSQNRRAEVSTPYFTQFVSEVAKMCCAPFRSSKNVFTAIIIIIIIKCYAKMATGAEWEKQMGGVFRVHD